jgi:hypothetical protein
MVLSVQWLVTKIDPAINAAPMTIAVFRPICGTMHRPAGPDQPSSMILPMGRPRQINV